MAKLSATPDTRRNPSAHFQSPVSRPMGRDSDDHISGYPFIVLLILFLGKIVQILWL